MLDNYAKQIFSKNVNMMVPWYIMASYSYYKNDKPILSDAFFDEMGKTMLSRWKEIQHFHKEYITLDELEAGTYLGEYPSRVEGAVQDLVRRFKL